MEAKTTTTEQKQQESTETLEDVTERYLHNLIMIEAHIKQHPEGRERLERKMAENIHGLVGSVFFFASIMLGVRKYIDRFIRRTGRGEPNLRKTRKHLKEIHRLAKILKV